MQKRLLNEFIRIQTIVLSPICPHFAEYVWRRLLGHDSSISYASWPKTVTPDRILVRSSEYIDTIISRGRNLIQDQMTKKGNISKDATCNLLVIVSNSFPEWKQKVISKLGSLYDETTRGLPDDVMKQMKSYCLQTPELKPIMKNAMQVAAFFIKKSQVESKQAFELQVDYAICYCYGLIYPYRFPLIKASS